MKMKRGKDKKQKKSSGYYKTKWVKGDRNGDECLIVPQQKEPVPKEIAKQIADSLAQGNSHIIAAHPSAESFQKKAKVIQMPVGRVRREHPPDRNIQVIISDEARVYARWAANSLKSKNDCELAYYSKLQHRRSMQTAASYTVPEPAVETEQQSSFKERESNPNHRSWFEYNKTTMTPSRLPISEFLEGGKYPPTQAHAVNAVEEEFYTGHKWYRNNVEEEYMPDIVFEYEDLFKDYSQLCVDVNCEREEMFEQLQKKQEEILDLKARVKQLDDELALADADEHLRKWEAELTSHYIASEAPQLDRLAKDFTLYKKLYEDNPLRSFTRERGISHEVEAQLREKFDRECEERVKANEQRQAERNAKLEAELLEQTRQHKLKVAAEVLAIRRIADKVTTCNSHLKVRADKKTFGKWAHRNTLPMCTERINYIQWWQDTLTPEKMAELEYASTPAQLELRNLKQSKYYPTAKTIHKGWSVFKHAMTKERQTPWAKYKADKLAHENEMRKRKQQSLADKAKHKRQVIATTKDEVRQRIRTMYGIAH
ncbi:MAG: hypothetical protein JSW41_04900 [Candidatus Aenigmatarchaeota archaeon]|nr:MAG: hypothetical protein JSW41_04900 [Candidatus Aenigmarchaeota archaeon]